MVEVPLKEAAVLVGTRLPFLQRRAEPELVCRCVMRQSVNSHSAVWAKDTDAHCLLCVSFMGFPREMLRWGAPCGSCADVTPTHQLAAFPEFTAAHPGRHWIVAFGGLFEQLECVRFGALKLTSVFIWSPSGLLYFSIYSYPVEIETRENHFCLYLGSS